MDIVTIDPYTDHRWIEFLSAHPEATIFHHPSWIGLLEETYGYRPLCTAALENEKIEAILPLMEVQSWLTGNRAVCLPFSDSCVPLSNSLAGLQALLEHAIDGYRGRRWKYVEVRGAVGHNAFQPAERFVLPIVRLQPDSQAVHRRFKKTAVQQSIAKSVRDGVTVERRADLDAMKEFMRLNVLTRRRLGVPPQPDRFFFNFHRHMIAGDYGFVTLARHENRVIAASVSLRLNQSVYYKYSASDERYLKYKPNHQTVWDTIQWGCENGCTVFDFGRTDPANEGLLRYKRGWGVEETELVYHRIADRPQKKAGRSGPLDRAKPLIKRLPAPVLKKVGELLYGHVG